MNETDKVIINILRMWKRECRVEEPIRFKYGNKRGDELLLIIFVSEIATRSMIGYNCIHREHFKNMLIKRLGCKVHIEFITVDKLWV